MATTLVDIDDIPATENVDTTHEDTNPKSKILFTMNIDTQEVNIVVDKDSTEVKNDNTRNIVEQPT